MQKIVFIITILFSVLLSACGVGQNNNPNSIIVDVDASTFKELINQPGTILDVRTPDEWADGIIAGAEKINFYNDNFTQQIEKLDKTTPVYLYCRSGGRSANAADILKEKGFTKVYNLDGGITSWQNNGFEVVK
ncbi:MAG: rhodanese-like domain-containing protein [Flavobacteriales bacterium]|nr:rhodanese-like domain-containing protein [Flavobacteriales bacterium]HRN40947.1 rhodanese-like domain-containing protein [Vicingus sp.]